MTFSQKKKHSKQPLKLTREDISYHVLTMYLNGERFIIQPRFKKRTSEELPDCLVCGEHYYGFVFEAKGFVNRFILRMSSDTAMNCADKHSLRCATMGNGDNWYELDVDGSFKEKEEIYRLLDLCYDFTLKECYVKKIAADDAEANTRCAATRT